MKENTKKLTSLTLTFFTSIIIALGQNDTLGDGDGDGGGLLDPPPDIQSIPVSDVPALMILCIVTIFFLVKKSAKTGWQSNVKI